MVAAEIPAETSTSKTSRSKRSATTSKRRGVVTRQDGRELRRVACYLPVAVARKLAIHAATIDVDVSAVISDAVEAHLSRS